MRVLNYATQRTADSSDVTKSKLGSALSKMAEAVARSFRSKGVLPLVGAGVLGLAAADCGGSSDHSGGSSNGASCSQPSASATMRADDEFNYCDVRFSIEDLAESCAYVKVERQNAPGPDSALIRFMDIMAGDRESVTYGDRRYIIKVLEINFADSDQNKSASFEFSMDHNTSGVLNSSCD